MRWLLLMLVMSGCSVTHDIAYNNKTIGRNVGYLIQGIPSDMGNCVNSGCSHNYRSATSNIMDNAYRGYRGAFRRGTESAVEDTLTLFLSPIIPEPKKAKSLETMY